MTTAEGPTIRTALERLDALCGALDYRLRRDVHRDWTEALHPMLDLARIVRDLHSSPQQPQERPETAPEGDGTTAPVSGRETGTRRFKVGDRVQVRVAGSHHYAATVIKADDGRFCRVRHDDGGHTAFAHVSWLEQLPTVEASAVEPFPPGGIVRVRDFGPGTVVTANGDYRTVRINRADVEYHVSWLRPWTEPTPDPVAVLPTTPGSVRAEEGLRLIAAWGCETSTRWPTDPMPCYTDGRTPDAQYGADRCCAPCIAWHHLVDAGTVA